MDLFNRPISPASLLSFLEVGMLCEASAEPQSLQALSYAQYVLCVITAAFPLPVSVRTQNFLLPGCRRHCATRVTILPARPAFPHLVLI